MSNHSGYISLGSITLHYLKYGVGDKLLIAFHGYGESASIFQVFEQYLKSEYTIVSFDLPYHGDSEWSDGVPFLIEHLKDLIHHTCQQFNVTKASLIGYSMGGRVCLKATEIIPAKVAQIILIASDGLVFNSFYYFVTRTYLGKNVFQSFLSNPKPFVPLISAGRTLGLITPSKYKFASNYIDDVADREFLLKVWPVMSPLIPNYKKLKKAITEHNILIDVYMGKYDNVIPPWQGEKFEKTFKSARVHVLEKGHRIFDDITVPLISSCVL